MWLEYPRGRSCCPTPLLDKSEKICLFCVSLKRSCHYYSSLQEDCKSMKTTLPMFTSFTRNVCNFRE